jgi:hypothetical protein
VKGYRDERQKIERQQTKSVAGAGYPFKATNPHLRNGGHENLNLGIYLSEDIANRCRDAHLADTRGMYPYATLVPLWNESKPRFQPITPDQRDSNRYGPC